MSSLSGECRRCVDCGTVSPVVKWSFQLLTEELGWRVSNRADRGAPTQLVWRCPDCAAKHHNSDKEQTGQ